MAVASVLAFSMTSCTNLAAMSIISVSSAVAVLTAGLLCPTFLSSNLLWTCLGEAWDLHLRSQISELRNDIDIDIDVGQSWTNE